MSRGIWKVPISKEKENQTLVMRRDRLGTQNDISQRRIE